MVVFILDSHAGESLTLIVYDGSACSYVVLCLPGMTTHYHRVALITIHEW